MLCLTCILYICDADCVNFNVYCVLLFIIYYLFAFCCSGVDDIGGGLERINYNKRKYDTILNICKGPPSLEEAWKPAAVISVASDNYGS